MKPYLFINLLNKYGHVQLLPPSSQQINIPSIATPPGAASPHIISSSRLPLPILSYTIPQSHIILSKIKKTPIYYPFIYQYPECIQDVSSISSLSLSN